MAEICSVCRMIRPTGTVHAYLHGGPPDYIPESIRPAQAGDRHILWICDTCEEAIVSARLNRTGQTVMTALPVPHSEEPKKET